MIRPRLALTGAAVLIATTTACGAATPPGELVPTLRTQLTQVEQALAAGDYPQARDALDTLDEQTATARDEGRITPDQADRILTAITRVAANLPEPTPPAPDGEQNDNGEENGKGTGNGGSKEKGKSEEKGKKRGEG